MTTRRPRRHCLETPRGTYGVFPPREFKDLPELLHVTFGSQSYSFKLFLSKYSCYCIFSLNQNRSLFSAQPFLILFSPATPFISRARHCLTLPTTWKRSKYHKAPQESFPVQALDAAATSERSRSRSRRRRRLDRRDISRCSKERP